MERRNFGFSEDEELAHCEEGNKFWWGEENKEVHKYFIKLDGEYLGEDQENRYLMKEQIRQGEVSTFYLKLEEMRGRLNDANWRSQVWLHNLPLNVPISTITNFLLPFQFLVTHLSLTRRYENVTWNDFFSLIQNMSHLEYLAIVPDFSGSLIINGGRTFSKLKTL